MGIDGWVVNNPVFLFAWLRIPSSEVLPLAHATGEEILDSIDEVWERVIIEDFSIGQPLRCGWVVVSKP